MRSSDEFLQGGGAKTSMAPGALSSAASDSGEGLVSNGFSDADIHVLSSVGSAERREDGSVNAATNVQDGYARQTVGEAVGSGRFDAASGGSRPGGYDSRRVRGIPPKLYRIGEIIDYSGLSRQTIHNYTTMGLLRESQWTRGGHRLYDESVFGRLDQVLCMKQQRKSMREIREHFSQLDQLQ